MLVSVRARAADTEDHAEAFARVVVDSAELRTGPGISFRVIYTATAARRSRSTGGKAAASGFVSSCRRPPRVRARRAGPAVRGERREIRAPRSLRDAAARRRARGVRDLRRLLSVPIATARRSVRLPRSAAVDRRRTDGHARRLHRRRAHRGRRADSSTARRHDLLRVPSWALCPFLGIGGGGLASSRNPTRSSLKREDLYMARAGGGFMLALRGRILVRLEASNFTLFTASQMKRANRHRRFRSVFLMKKIAFVVCALALNSCVTVRPQQRAVLADPIMQFEGDPTAPISSGTRSTTAKAGTAAGVSSGGCGCN